MNPLHPVLNLAFAHAWDAEILSARPLILPPRHFTYPRQAEEVERGALEIMVRPRAHTDSPSPQAFLATCALGFRDPAVPTGVWSAPRAEEICAVAGGYAYLIDTSNPEKFIQLPYRPVLAVRPVPEHHLLLFVGHRQVLAWGREGQAWESEKLSDEGVTLDEIQGQELHGLGWEMRTDREVGFRLDLRTGKRV